MESALGKLGQVQRAGKCWQMCWTCHQANEKVTISAVAFRVFSQTAEVSMPTLAARGCEAELYENCHDHFEPRKCFH